ncbi:obscurin isoform X5 [Vanessa atalanta]|uniref:obscurin isoform X5 n=1 Tax=Vanessa atalanta TaxID=42275 RepID=UPI001FCCD2B7|nr:obscurin isoform X5 [Vanessa atalanta]
MSFCRITGRSRGLPKPNYFPLLAPISPADAKRCCRITGKSYGLPSHHYIPVLLTANSAKTKCKITNVSGELGPHHYSPEINYGNRKHEILPDYRYIFPILDGSTDAQRALMEVLLTKQVADDKRYVYTVQERRCSLVFSARMEAAVRDGDVRDVMLAKDSDTVLIKTKQGRSVSMDFKDFTEEVDIFEGEGPNAEVLKQREAEELEERKKKRKRAAGLSSMKKIFENKEKLAEVQELEEEKLRQDRLAKKAKMEEVRHEKHDIKSFSCNNFDLNHMRSKSSIIRCSGDWKDQIHPLIENWDWDLFEKEIKNESFTPKVTSLPSPIKITPYHCETEIYEVDRNICDVSITLESVPCVNPLKPIKSRPSEEVLSAVTTLPQERLVETSNVTEKLLECNKIDMLPTIENLPDIVKNIKKGKKEKIGKISGLTLDIDKAKKFIPGQHVTTPQGTLFIPGQTVETPAGLLFVPGLSVNTPAGPGLIPGHFINNETTNEPFFLVGQVLQTTNGDEFVCGQTVKNKDETYRFIEGQTVLSEEGVKFVPGKSINNGLEDVFVPGQAIMTPDGVQFIPGQTIIEKGNVIFTPGQNAKINNEWQFIPGQVIHQDDELHFIPGATLATPNGLKFIPGQTVTTNGETLFVPGITKMGENDLEFIPGTTVDTIDGPKFVEGQIVTSGHIEKFLPGKTIVQSNGHVEFSVAKSIEDITFTESTPTGLPIDIKTCSLSEESLYVFGHMVQTSNGIEFYPGPRIPKLDGKVVPGRLVKNEANQSRFVPGMMVEGIFVPGQIVFTENGEQFVPGQVVDTVDGPKFVPGQVVNTKSGPKFVPGQTIHTIDGPRFVPGQIIDTKAGPTFIPGQVISTEDEGSRFVPGQVVDTDEGPRFVPGRVIETDDQGVTFVPGQIVQTPEGLKFVAPDLIEGEEGLEFSVQSFVVTPEELKLLKVKTNPNDTTSTKGELTIDTKMLRQLSEAGMSIGRQVPADLPAINVILNQTKNAETLKAFVTDFGLKDEVANQLMDVIKSIIEMSVHLKSEINVNHKENGLIVDGKKSRANKKRMDEINRIENAEDQEQNTRQEKVKNSIAAAVLAALVTAEQYEEVNNNNGKEKYHHILKSIDTILGKAIDEDFVSAMFKILQREEDKELLSEAIVENSTIPKMELIKIAINNALDKNSLTQEQMIDKFSEFLSQENEVIGPAFKNISKNDPILLNKIINNISESISFVKTDHVATEALQKIIVAAIQESSNKTLENVLDGSNKELLKETIIQSAGLARVLGLNNVAKKLLSVIDNEQGLSKIESDDESMNILRRLTVMRKLAEQNPSLHSAIRKLETDAELARTDPKLRDLVRESAALMIVPEEPPLLTSEDVPLSLLQPENSLAMEDFLFQRKKHPGALLIMKKGLQAVVPREASRAVLTGQVAYTVLDENGIRHFEPLHVFSALNLSQPTAHRFSMYSCPVLDDNDEDLQSFTGYCNISQNQRITKYGGWNKKYNGVLLDRENTRSRMTSLKNTPSYERYNSRSLTRSRSTCSRSPSKVDDVVVATADYTAAGDDEVSLKAGDIVEVLDTKAALGSKNPQIDSSLNVEAELLDASAAKHKLAVRPKKNHPKKQTKKTQVAERWLVRVVEDVQGGELCTRQGYVPAHVLKEKVPERDQTALTARRQAVVRELIETEEEFGRDMQQVVSRYMRPMDKATTPKIVFDNRELLFSNFKQICEFHNTSLLEGIKYYAGEPRMLGRSLLRMEREFDKHVAYCRDEPLAQHLLKNDPVVSKYFKALADKLGDDKGLTEHLKLPIQRINDYQLLLKELVKYSKRLGDDCTDLQKALELFLGVPNRATNNIFIDSIEGYRGNIYKLGRLLTHDWFTVDYDGEPRNHYVFLFKARILLCEVQRVGEDRSVFVLRHIVKLPEVEIKDHPESTKFELHQKDPYLVFNFKAHKESVKTAWLREIRQYASDLVALAEHAADDLQILPQEIIEQQPEERRKRELEDRQEERQEKKSRVEELEVTELSSKEESQQVIKTKRKASFEGEHTSKISKAEATEVSSITEVQEVHSSVSTVESQVTASLESTSFTTQVSEVESVTSQSQISQQTIIQTNENIISQEETAALSIETAQKEIVQSGNGTSEIIADSVVKTEVNTKAEGKVSSKSLSEQTSSTTLDSTSIETKSKEELLVESKVAEESVKDSESVSYSRQVTETIALSEVQEAVSSVNQNELGETSQEIIQTTSTNADVKSSESSCTDTVQTIKEENVVTTESEYEKTKSLSAKKESVVEEKAEQILNINTKSSQETSDKTQETISYSRQTSKVLVEQLQSTEEKEVKSKRIEDSETQSAFQSSLESKVSLTSQQSVIEEKKQESKKNVQSSKEESAVTSNESNNTKTSSADITDKIVEKTKAEVLENGKTTESRSSIKSKKLESKQITEVDQTAEVSVSQKVEETNQTVTTGELGERVSAEDQAVTTEEADGEMSRYSRSSRLSGEYSSSSRKLSTGGRYESSSYDSTGASSYRRESGSRIESAKYEAGSVLEGSASSRYESKYSTSSKTEGGSKYGIESSYDTKNGSKYAIESESKLDSIASKYGLGSNTETQVEGRTNKYSVESSYDGNSTDTTSKIDSIASKYGLGTNSELQIEGRSSKYSVEASYDGNSVDTTSKIDSIASKYGRNSITDSAKIEGRSTKLSIETSYDGDINGESKIESSYTKIKNGDTVSKKKYSKTNISNDSVTEERASTKSISKSESSDGKPIFVKTIEGQNIEPGENAIFECALQEAEAKVTWLKDNKPFSDRLMDRVVMEEREGRYRLEVLHCREDDSGVYTARAENVKGNAHCTAQLVVHELTPEERKQRNALNAPYFVVALKDTEIMMNTYLRFMVKVKGNPNPEVKFYRDGKEIVTSSTEERVNIVRTRAERGCYELVIADVLAQDAGRYSCRAINEYGEVTSEALVTVVDDKNIFGELPPGGEGLLAKGEKASFTWKKDGVDFDPEERFKVLLEDDEDSLALVFQHVKPEDAGLYTCVAKTSTGNISCSAELTVQGAVNFLHREPTKPQLVIEHREAIVSSGGSAMLELVCKGYPKPNVVFKHDGKVVEADTRHKFLHEDDESMSLVIKNVTSADAGEYHVTASNDLGEDTTIMNLIVKAPPKIKKKIENQTCMAGSTHEVIIEVEGSPSPDVSFYKDGVEIKSSERITIVKESEEIYKIIIKDTKLTDTGSYSVVAKNEVNQCSDFWQWHVTSPPKILQMLGGERSCGENDSVTFEVHAEGDPAPTVTWYKNKTELKESSAIKITSSGEAHKLVITSAARADSGEYSCEIRNVHGSASDSCVLNVRRAPSFTQRLCDTTAAEGDVNVEFTVDVDAYPQPNVKWYLGDVEITEKKSVYTRLDNGSTHKLILKEVTAELSGQYTCKVSNELGEDSCQATFTVNRKPRITKSLVDMTVDVGQTLKLEVEVEGCPEPKIKWYKDGKEVTTDARIKIERDTQRLENYFLTVTLVKEEDGGEYEVRADNEMGSVACKSTVTVHTPPKLKESSMKDGHTYESLPMVYTVEASGTPKPTIRWLHDGQEVKPNGRVHITNIGDLYKLEIDTVDLKDAGNWQCEVINDLGKQTLQAELSVSPVADLRKPIFTAPLEAQHVMQREPVTLKAVCTADPLPHVAWLLNGKELTPDATLVVNEESKELDHGIKECTFTLHIPTGRHTDTGIYTVQAKNKYGLSESSARLDILLRPEVEPLKDITIVPFEEITFITKIRANPVAEVKWSKDGYVIQPSTRHEIIEDREAETFKLVIKNVGLEDAGQYTVTATNEIGETTQQAKLNVHTDKPAFVRPIQKQIVKDYDDCTLRVRCDGVPKPQVKWFLNGKEVVNDDRHTITTEVGGQVDSELEIKHFGASDAGKYTVRAMSVSGEAECEAMISLAQIPPGFSHKLDRQKDVDEGEPLELKAKVDGSPIPTAKWLKDGVELSPDDSHVKQTVLPDGTVKLTIEHVTPADCGAYKLVINNPSGEHMAICAVAVNPTPRKPSFSQELEDVKVVVGQPVQLEAKVMAFPAPEVKWFKDGVPVRPSQAVNFINQPGGVVGLSIDSCRPEDAGVYSLVVTNRLGEVASKAKVEVGQKERKPAFIAELQPAKVIEGFPVKLEVKVIGHPPPTIKWTHNGKEVVPDGQRVRVISQPDGSHALLLSEASAPDAGRYGVIAINEKGQSGCEAELSVAGREDASVPQERPQFIHGLREVTGEEGKPLNISAPFTGNPVPQVTWTKDGQPLKPNERIFLTCDGKKVGMEINSLELPDAGVYSVKLVNPLGEDTTEGKINVRKVFQPPRFTQKFTDLQQLPTFDAKFPARVIGLPAPDITWYKNGTLLKASDKYSIKRDGDACCLYVRDITQDDAGQYKCVAKNKEGEDSCEAVLEVVDKIGRKQKVEPPTFLKKIGDAEVIRGLSAKFTACATGTPEPEVEWFRNDDKLFPSERIRIEQETTGLLRLTIGGVGPEDVATYRCRIYNPHGEESCTAQLIYDTLEPQSGKKPMSEQYSDFDKMKKTGVPMPLTDKPIISRMADRHLTLSWKPSIPHQPRFPVTYQVEMCEVPDGDWFTARTGLRSCVCDIRNLEPFRDYKFRVRVENKYGVSDPSPYANTHRAKLEPDPPKFVPYLEPGIDFRPETSPYFPRDFDIERPPHDGYAQAPKFLRQEYDSQYGVKGHNVNLFWFVYGYPKPKMTYYFNDEPIEIGGRYDWSYTRNGQATLFINKMLERDVGWYEAVASNEHGQARQRVRLQLAEYPTFLKRPEECVVLQRRLARIEARVAGVPFPDIKWYKDWQPLAQSSRIKMHFIEPDTVVLTISDVMLKDEGLYSVSARNVAGAVSASAMLYVEESEHEYSARTREYPPRIKASSKPFGDYYDLGDELGRGVQGVVYHAAERTSGRNYAAKIMHGHSDLKPFMKNELDIMNILNDRHLVRLYDAYEHDHTLALVSELAAGGELVRDRLLRSQGYTEREVAGYVRQLLRGLKHMHDNSVAHLGLTIGELLLSHAGSDLLKICDFGLSRRIQMNKYASLDYGMPEFVSPEVANGEGVSFASDMWSVGIITYILLSGHSPFRGANDRETLTNVRAGSWSWHDEDWWSRFSAESRDFISRLLQVRWHDRLDVDAALAHPWLLRADKIYEDEYIITTDRLRNYYNLYRDWTSNAQCRTWFRRRPLSGAFDHPSKMVYPPGEIYTPEGTPDRDRASHERKPGDWDIKFKQWEHPDWEVSAKSESHYQNGPDTYLLQLRDTQFPVRLREYMKVACHRSPGYSLSIQDAYDPRTPIIRERRRFTDIMDEEIDDERRERINNYGSESYTIRRLRHELGTRLDSYAEAQAFMESKKDGQLPFFREKPQVLPVQEGEQTQLSCYAVGDPKPVIQWFKNDMVIAEGQRIKIIEDEEGRSTLRFDPAMHHDIGFYKVVARNKVGQTVARTRIVEATNPDAPDSPTATEVSDKEVLLRWKQPKYDGNSPVVCYSLQYKKGDSVEWNTVAENIDHEFFVVRDLEPDTSYQFRLSSRNRIGWSDKGIPTSLIKTKEAGAPKIEVTKAMRHLQQITESGQEIVLHEDRPKLDYATEDNPIDWDATQNFSERYSFISELWRGKFSIVVKGVDKTTDSVVVAKILEVRPETEIQVQREFSCLRKLRHERISNLLGAYQIPGSPVAALILEKLQGADVLTYLSSRHDYSEQMVATIITQALDGLQYLHWRGYCHLDLQPDNVVMASVRSIQVKLIDFGSAHRVTKLGTSVPQVGELEYKAPEIINDEAAYPQTDIWSLGVLAYILLSGVSPFRGTDDAETKQNISFVRYRFEHLYKEITQEATRFLMLVFKKVPLKRPTAEECHEHRWLAHSDFTQRKRERAVFLSNRLKEFSDEYHERKSREASQADTLASFGSPRILTRSNSITDELLTTSSSR